MCVCVSNWGKSLHAFVFRAPQSHALIASHVEATLKCTRAKHALAEHSHPLFCFGTFFVLIPSPFCRWVVGKWGGGGAHFGPPLCQDALSRGVDLDIFVQLYAAGGPRKPPLIAPQKGQWATLVTRCSPQPTKTCWEDRVNPKRACAPELAGSP